MLITMNQIKECKELNGRLRRGLLSVALLVTAWVGFTLVRSQDSTQLNSITHFLYCLNQCTYIYNIHNKEIIRQSRQVPFLENTSFSTFP